MGAAMADSESRRRRAKTDERLPLPDEVALVLQGGGALGAYQGGVIAGLEEKGIEVDWVAGISIGAVNAAIFAGNPPERRVAKLRGFWEEVTAALPALPFAGGGEEWREWVHIASAGVVAMQGVPGFFTPRLLTPALAPAKSLAALSFYDNAPLRATLDRYVDWDLLNDGPVRLSVGAVNVETGNFRYFDTRGEGRTRIDARHIMASGALPPGLPPVEIDGDWWWDGGIVSNTPLSHVLDHQKADLLVFQVDLFSAKGERPATIVDVTSREKDIRYSSRTRQVTDQLLRLRKEREAIRKVLDKLPPELCQDEDVANLAALAAEYAVNVVHLIYRKHGWEGGARDFEFSRDTMEHHWAEGLKAIAETMRHDSLLARNIVDGRTAAFDLVS
jgi:NTE family protein